MKPNWERYFSKYACFPLESKRLGVHVTAILSCSHRPCTHLLEAALVYGPINSSNQLGQLARMLKLLCYYGGLIEVRDVDELLQQILPQGFVR